MTSGQAGEEGGGLFRGMSFWLSQNVPQRNRFKELIQQHGGVIRLLEKDADVQLVDHKRKNLPPNTYSYQFIEKSIEKGKLEDLETYKTGLTAPRPVGATHIATRGHRLAYSIQDDQILWDWMQPHESNPAARIRGNKIYQELAAMHPRHTYQSYRDRYLKRLRGLPRPGGMPVSTEAQPSGEEASRRSRSRTPTPRASEVQTRTSEASKKPQERSSASHTSTSRRGEPATRTDEGLLRSQARTSSAHTPAARPSESTTQTNEALVRSQDRRSASHTSASRPGESGTDVGKALQKPQERKRKRSPESPASNRGESNGMNVTQKRRVTAQTLPEIPIPPTSLNQREEPPRREVPPSPKKARITTEPSTVTAITQEPAGEASFGIQNPFLELPFFPSSPEPEVAPEQDIDAWIDDHLRSSKGASEAQIIEALRCTSMDPELAKTVLESLVAGKGIPTDMRGVWTAQDDRCVEAKDTRDIQRVLKKHGSDLFNARWEYLEMARVAGLEKPTDT